MPISIPFNEQYITNVDESDSTYSYVGEANFNSLESNPVWRIKRIENGATSTKIRWADGNTDFDNIWDNRASLTYS